MTKRILVFLLGAGLLFAWVALPRAAAQEPLQPPPQPGDAMAGFQLFQERCANCHGPRGMGDGELAAQLPSPPKPIGDGIYIQDAVPATMYDVVSNGRLEKGMPPFGSGSSNPLTVQQRWDVIAAVYSLATAAESIAAGADSAESLTLADQLAAVDWLNTSNNAAAAQLADSGLDGPALADLVNFGRSRTYTYFDIAALDRPVPFARVSGDVFNGSTGEAVSAVPVMLQGYDRQFQVRQTLTTTVGTDGTFEFELTDVSQDWVFLAFIDYSGINFSSDVIRFSPLEAEQTLPVTVYDTTNDSAEIEIERLHVILDFANDSVGVNEFYSISNLSNRVFVGADGSDGRETVAIDLPDGAQNVDFRRSLGSDFVPANEMVPTASGYADTVPLRPGINTLGLLVSYDLPYSSGMTIEHPLAYPARAVSLVMPNAGVTVAGDGWTSGGAQEIQGQSFLSYQGTAGDVVSLTLEGRLRAVSGGNSRMANRDQSAELILGAGALVIALAGSAYVVNQWRTRPPADPEALLEELADLDDAFDAGEVSEREYVRRREQLKNELRDVWDV